mmetsp:Transcript_6493/g.14035  ORF Transcript_6493/g.14035 Transcript_6493/m.14035 type:complete len:113 (-) Transcript_6493:10-348(-)
MLSFSQILFLWYFFITFLQDQPIPNSSGIGYGSMQIHAEDPSDPTKPRNTVFALNRFNRGLVADLGIGSQTTGQPDWTGAKNAGAYDRVRRLRVYVLPREPPSPTPPPPQKH